MKIEGLFKLVGALTAQCALEPAKRDEKAVLDLTGRLDKALKEDVDEVAHVLSLRAEVETLKKNLDAQAETVRAWQKAGLSVSGRQAVLPKGRAERIEMLRDNRAFADDETAKRFGAWTIRAFLAVSGKASACPKFVAVLADSVDKDAAAALAKGDMDPLTPSAGGYVIPDEFRMELIRNVEATGVFFPRCRRIPLVTTGSTKIPKRTAGLTAYWKNPATAIDRSAPTLEQVTLAPEKLAALVAVPNEFARSALLVELGNWIGVELVESIQYALDDALVNGDGSATYGGITGIRQSATLGSVTAAAHQTAATLDGTDVSAVIAGVAKDYVMRNPAWGMSLSVKSLLRALKSTTGVPLYQQGNNGEPNAIDGYPYTIGNVMPAAAACTAGVKWGFFGDLSQSHLVGMVRGIEIATSEHVYFAEDMTAIRAVVHADIQEQDANALVVAKTHS